MIDATGVLTHPKMPDIPGRGRRSPERRCTPHAGTTPLDLRGKRVAVIGTGASAVQVIPAIAPRSST